MSEEDQAKQAAAADAERRAKAAKELEDLGLEDPYDGWAEEDPYDYLPYQVNYPKGSAKEMEAALRRQKAKERMEASIKRRHD